MIQCQSRGKYAALICQTVRQTYDHGKISFEALERLRRHPSCSASAISKYIPACAPPTNPRATSWLHIDWSDSEIIWTLPVHASPSRFANGTRALPSNRVGSASLRQNLFYARIQQLKTDGCSCAGMLYCIKSGGIRQVTRSGVQFCPSCSP